MILASEFIKGMSRTSLSTQKQDDIAVNDSSIINKGKFFNVFIFTRTYQRLAVIQPTFWYRRTVVTILRVHAESLYVSILIVILNNVTVNSQSFTNLYTLH